MFRSQKESARVKAGHSTRLFFVLHYFKMLLQNLGDIWKRKSLTLLVTWIKYRQWKLLEGYIGIEMVRISGIIYLILHFKPLN